MENYVPVITTKGRPLAPCHPHRAKSLVRAGKARFQHRSGTRYIVLFKSNVPKLKHAAKLQLRLDPGSEHTGLAITREHADGSRSVLTAIDLQYRGKAIKKALTKRSQKRRKRRGRKTRYRQPRFNNRTRQPDWLPPSILSRLQNTLTWVSAASANCCPSPKSTLRPPCSTRNCSATQTYKARSTNRGRCTASTCAPPYSSATTTSARTAAGPASAAAPNWTMWCPKPPAGADRYDNLVVACNKCNQKKANQPLEQFLQRRPQKLAEVKAKLGQDLAPATHLNVILPRLLKELRTDGWNVVEHAAATTAAGRITCGIQKSQPRRRRTHRLPQRATLYARRAHRHQSHGTWHVPTHHAR